MNPIQAEKDWPPVVVGDAFQTGLNLMRDLIRHGVRTVAVDCDPSHEGFRSVYGKTHLCPNPDKNPEAWIAFMKRLAKEMKAKPVIIPAADIWVEALGRLKNELRHDYIFSESTVALQAALSTKEQQYALAAERGFPCPRTEYIQNREGLEKFASTARFPCLLKPRHQREWAVLPAGHRLRGEKLVTADTAAELLGHYDSVASWRPEVMVQEIILGPDSAKYCYLSTYGRDGRCLGWCVVQEFRAHPVGFGSASIVQPVMDEEIRSVCDSFLRGINYTGICEIEVKRDTRDGRVMLVEVNPRFSGTGDSAIYAGVEVGWLAYLDLIGVPVAPVEPTRFNFRHVTLKRDVPGAIRYLEDGMITWRELMDSYRMPLEFYDFDVRDWRVAAGNTWFCMRRVGGAMLRRVGLKKRKR